MVLSLNLMKNINMTHKELIDQVSANLFKQSGKLESRRSWLAMRNYLEQLDTGSDGYCKLCTLIGLSVP
jgi:hypothetical protein